MIRCQNCLHQEMFGALFCNECGAQLVSSEGIPTSGIEDTTISTKDFPKAGQEAPVIAVGPIPPEMNKAKIILSLMENGEFLPLGGREEVTLGRVSEGQPVIPDIDLSPYKALEAGVSRMHASISAMDNEISIIDLGSANGTRINGQKIPPHTSHPLNHGDILTLGKLKIQILFQTPNNDGG